MRKDLLEYENCEIVESVDKCPNIFVKIQGVKTEALIDTGSEVTCISEHFFENNKNKLINCKILPIVGTSVIGATGVKPMKLKHQIYAYLNINEMYSCVFIIIPKLNKNCILGIDVLKKLKGRINIEENYVILRNEDKELKIEFINDEEKCIRVIHEMNIEPNDELMNINPQDCANNVNYPEKYEEFCNVKKYDGIEEKYCIPTLKSKKKWQNVNSSTAKRRRSSGRF